MLEKKNKKTHIDGNVIYRRQNQIQADRFAVLHATDFTGMTPEEILTQQEEFLLKTQFKPKDKKPL